MKEPAYVDEAKVEGEEQPAGGQPEYDERSLRPEYGNREEYDARQEIRCRAHGVVNSSVYSHNV